MPNQTSKNCQYYNKNDKNATILHTIDYAIYSFCLKLGFNSGFFSQFLPYSEKQFPKYLNPCDDSHNLKLNDLQTILFHLDKSHKKIILDSLCHSNGFICVDEQSTNNKYSSLENLLLSITATNGQLATSFLDSMKDGNINKNESKKLKAIAYQLREVLLSFEKRISE